jgi:hypothetical protein
MARNWSCARRSAPRSRWPASAARSSAAPLARLAAGATGSRSPAASMTEDYEMGLRSARLASRPCSCASRHIPGSRCGGGHPRDIFRHAGRGRSPEGALDRRHRALRLGPARLEAAASANAGCGCATGAARWPRCFCWPAMRPRCCGCSSARRGARRAGPGPGSRPRSTLLLQINLALLACGDAGALLRYLRLRLGEGLRSLPRLVVGNLIAILAARRAVALHLGGAPPEVGQDPHISRRRRPYR